MMHLPFVAAAAVLAIDQASKAIVLLVLQLDQVGRIDVLPPFLVFQMGWNFGINFGLLNSGSELMRWILIGIAVAVAAFLLVWSVRTKISEFERICAGALAGGALGNAVDRVFHGAVVDFLNMSCCGINNPFVFNLADVAIVVGAGGLVMFGMIKPGKVD